MIKLWHSYWETQVFLALLCFSIGLELEYDVEEKGPGHARVYHCKVKYDCCNRPFYSCVLSCQAFEWKWGWSWPDFDRHLTAFSYVNNAVLNLLTRRNLHKKRSELSIKTRSSPASLSFKGHPIKPTTLKWSIYHYHLV